MVSLFLSRVGDRRSRLAMLCAAVIALAGCAETAIRNLSDSAMSAGQYDTAIRELEEGVRRHPESVQLRSALIQARAQALAELVATAQTARQTGNQDEARKALEKALALDPQNDRVVALLEDLTRDQRSAADLAQAKRLAEAQQVSRALQLLDQALKDNPRHSGLQDLQRDLQARQRASQVQALTSGLSETRPISLDFREASLRTVLDVVTRHSGINFVLDKDVRSDVRVTVYLRNAKVEDALDLITGSNQLAKKVMDSRTIVIYPNTPEKQREYQEQIVRVFTLNNGEAKGAAAFLKSMLKIREPFVDERSNMLSLRDSPENIQLAERLMAVYDSPEPEVLLELEVLQVSSTRLTQLGVQLPNTASLTLLDPSGGTSLNLANLSRVTRDRVGVGIGSASLNLRREVGDVSTLANPKLRVRNREHAKVMIGDKIPIVAATAGTGGFVSETVSYVDVGLKLEADPTIYANDEVGIKIGLEVSSLGTITKTASGTVAYQISTRNANTVLRLHDGETQLLAGLISRDESTSANRIPGLGDLPVVGRLFANTTDSGQRNELLLAITPHILRNVRRLSASESELWVGTDANPKLRPVGGLQSTEVPSSAAATPAPTPTSAASPATSAPSSTGGADAVSERKPPSLVIDAPRQVKVGETFEVTMNLRDAKLRGLMTDLRFSPDTLSFVDAEEGGYFKQGEAATGVSKQLNKDVLSLGVLRNQASSAEGSGTVFKLRFKALAAGRATVSAGALRPVALETQPPVAAPQPLTIEVQ
ncbi:tetratricopeptide repeat protein [Paucibacter sp. R3-3]|uniref:Tetratricopeptide repeat protein n=1 Tax=Roseateles agri TaxID=3098619 RepID=A0ABU5DAV4_9BURK|nr:tetratricopeptide repeat protein [Paucibacter sp. R3-3]MDY0743353.1 tetratricopeptide repeat protein [Paucibacter sp. R3-3]